jgi:hypothetical protein
MQLSPHRRRTWQQRLLLAAVTGLISGATRALITWALTH